MLSNAPVTPTLPATDINRAKQFYTEKLGLKEASVPNIPPDSVMFDCGQGTMLFIYQRPPSPAQHTLAGFKVDDLAAEMAELRSRGVVFEEYDFPGLKTVDGIADDGSSKSAWFRDSEGNILALNQM
jgi:predicted enzyme related to lactoylglutathione lyase